MKTLEKLLNASGYTITTSFPKTIWANKKSEIVKVYIHITKSSYYHVEISEIYDSFGKNRTFSVKSLKEVIEALHLMPLSKN
jgi:hypothetical protein